MSFKRNFDLNKDAKRGILAVRKEMLKLGLQIRKDAIKYLDDNKVNMDGTIKRTINREVDLFMNGLAARLKVGTNAEHARFVHDGTRPRKTLPPFEPIRYWVEKKLNIAGEGEIAKVANAIRWSIKNRGTSMSAPGSGKGPRGKPFLDFALERHKDKFASRMQKAYLEGFNGQ